MTSYTPDQNFDNFPKDIEKLNRDLYATELVVLDAQNAVDELESGYKTIAANEAGLTNDAKRKAYVDEQRSADPAYGDAYARLAGARFEVFDAQQILHRVRNEFGVAKLQYERGTALVGAGLARLVHDLRDT